MRKKEEEQSDVRTRVAPATVPLRQGRSATSGSRPSSARVRSSLFLFHLSTNTPTPPWSTPSTFVMFPKQRSTQPKPVAPRLTVAPCSCLATVPGSPSKLTRPHRIAMKPSTAKNQAS